MMMKSISGTLKNFSLEALSYVLNSNAVTITAPTATEVGFRDVDLDVGTLVANMAVLARVGASPYDTPNVRTAGFNSEVYYPRAIEASSFEGILSPKASTMFPFMFEGLKSNTPALRGNLRVTDLATI